MNDFNREEKAYSSTHFCANSMEKQHNLTTIATTLQNTMICQSLKELVGLLPSHQAVQKENYQRHSSKIPQHTAYSVD